jgi:hypothetical protein
MATVTAPRLQIVKSAAGDEQELQELREWFRQHDIENFANNLEAARAMFREYPELVQAESFPEPYRSAFIKVYEYDPDYETDLNVGGLHISDPAEAEKEWDERARAIIAQRRAEERQKLDAQAADALSRTRSASQLVQ